MRTREIKKARKTMHEALLDKDLRMGYVANIAMCLYDNIPPGKRGLIANRDERNRIAEEILKRLFD